MREEDRRRRANAVSMAMSAVVVATGLIVLLGWALEIRVLQSVVPGWPAMAPATALCFVFTGAALWCARPTPRTSGPQRLGHFALLAQLLGALAALVGVVRLTQLATSWVPAVLVSHFESTGMALMSPATALSFVLIGGALVCAARALSPLVLQICAVVTLMIGWLGLSRYLYGGAPLIAYAAMAIHTALGFLFLSVGVLCLRPDVSVMGLVTRRSPGGSIARRLLPAAILVPLLMGWLPLYAERQGLLGTEAGFSLFALTGVLVFGALVWINAASVDRSEARRLQAQEEREASEERTRLILETALDAVISIDHEGRITAWSGQAPSIFGWSAEEAIGHTLTETIVPRQLRIAHLQGLHRYMATGQARILGRRVEVIALHRDGHEFPVEIAITPLRTGGHAAFSAFVRDITERRHTESRLRESEARFRTLADSAPVLIWMTDTQNQCVWFNRRWLEFVGRTLDQEVGAGWTENVQPDDLARCAPIADAAVRARQPFSFEYRLRRHDGAWRSVLTHGAPLLGTGGDYSGYVGSAVDVTERLEIMRDLQASEARFRTLAESLPQLVWTCRPDGWCDYLSRQWLDYTGRTHEEQVGYGWAEQLHPEDRERARLEWQSAIERGDNLDIEFRLRRADGVYRWFKTRAVPLRDAKGEITKWFGSNTDFDDIKRADERLRTQLRRLVLLDQITHAIGERQDLRSIFQVVVGSLEDHLSIDFGCMGLYDSAAGTLAISCVGTRSKALARAVALDEGAVVPIDANGLSRCIGGAFVNEPDIAAVPYPFPRRLAHAGLRSLIIAPLSADSAVFAVLMVARQEIASFTSGDCEFLRQLCDHVALAAHQARLYTDLQRTYEDLRTTQATLMQQERLRAFGQMASGVAHDINNALSPAALYVQSLLERDTSLGAQTREYLESTRLAIDDVANTVARMREFYRQREPELLHQAVDLNETIEQAIELTRARWSAIPQERGIVIELETQLADGLPSVLGVHSEIHDALVNLILNAVDAMPSGGVLRMRSRETGTHAIVEVQDTGLGMDEATRLRCIEPFFTTKGERGTGLGLAMVYGAMERHGGALEIESEPGRGTTIRLRLLLPERPPSAVAAESVSIRPLRSLRLLLIDDDPLLLESLQTVLEADGHRVSGVDRGEAGVSAFTEAQRGQRPFDVVITDLGMPHMDGRQVAAAIKAESGETPVILLTGWGHRLLAENAMPAHIDRVLSKPPKLMELRRALADLSQPANS